MIQMSLEEVHQVTNGTAFGDLSINFKGISTDSRTIQPGNLFIALKGERYDGHDFLEMAKQQGAAALLIEKKPHSSLPYVQVKDSISALGALAHHWRQRFHIPFIGITGSNGKTTLKNMVASILKAHVTDPNDVLATVGNLNNHIGLPLTLCQLNNQHRFAVIEMGMNHFGEIAYLTDMTKPQVAIITNAALCHIEGVKDIQGVATAKGEIFNGLTSNGTAILNRDDTYYDYWKNLIKDQTILTFGWHENADVRSVLNDNGQMLLKTPKGQISIHLPLLGKHNCLNAMAATAATLALNIDLNTIKKGLEKVTPAPGRMQEIILKNGLRIIDDTYNANPFSLEAAVSTLSIFSGTKILVLGDMRELGENAEQYHQLAGEKLRHSIDFLFTLGRLSEETSRAFGKNAKHFKHREELIEDLKKFLKEDMVLLVKGSRGMQMEKVIKALIPDLPLINSH